MNKKRNIVVASFVLVLITLISGPLQACIIILVPTLNSEKITITVPDPIVCGLNCFDSASVDVTCPTFNCNRLVANGCPSDAECKAPRNPNGTRNAIAGAHGNCFVPERWTGWIVLSGSGCTADAKATAIKKETVTNITMEVITVSWLVIWLPVHDFFWVTGFDEGADGTVEMIFVVEDTQNPGIPLLESITTFHAQSPNLVWDSTGQLMWERFPFYDQSRGKLYNNAFRPLPQQIVVGEFFAELQPMESIELAYTLSTEARLLHSQSASKDGSDSELNGESDIISKTVGIEACFDTFESDINKDCKVDLLDLSIMAAQWLQVGQLL